MHSKGEWTAFYLMEEGFWNAFTISMCPLTHALLKKLPICESNFGYVYFSVLSPHTSIDTHCGVTNTKLRIQLPLKFQNDEEEIECFSNCFITVNNDVRQYVPEKAIIFDDSFAHSVSNNCDVERVVLLIDIWHPSLSQSSIMEIKSSLSSNGDVLLDGGHFSKVPIPTKQEEHTTRTFDYLLKIVVTGERSAGKSNFVIRWANDEFNDYMSTLGVDFKMRTLQIRNSLVKVQLWDSSSGPERFRTITKSFYRGAHIILVLVDVSDALFFQHAEHYISETVKFTDVDTQTIVLVGTKIDCIATRRVTFDEAQAFAFARGLFYFETSSKTGFGIQDGVRHAVKSYLLRGLQNGNIKLPVTKVEAKQISTNSRKTCEIQ